MRPNGTIRTLPASATGYYREEYQLQRQNLQRKIQFASALANKVTEDGDERGVVRCDKKAVMRKFLSSLDDKHHHQRRSVSATSIKATTTALKARASTNIRASSLANRHPEATRPSVSTVLSSKDDRHCQDEGERDADPPTDVSSSSRDDGIEYDGDGDYDASSSDDSSTEGGEGLELSLQVDPDDDDEDDEEQQLPCAQVSFDKSNETRDDDELSIFSSSDQVDPFDLAIFEHVCDPFPDDQVEIDFLSHP